MAGVARRSNPPSALLPNLIREMPPEERPRQRLLRSGGQCLSHAEVLALVLGNGCREVCSLALARESLDEAGTLDGLVGVRPEALLGRGLGEAKAASVLAALELARQLVEVQMPEWVPMERPERVVPYLVLLYALRDQEVMGARYLDTRKRLVGEREVFRTPSRRPRWSPGRSSSRPWCEGRHGDGLALAPKRRSFAEPGDLSFTPRMAEACDARERSWWTTSSSAAPGGGCRSGSGGLGEGRRSALRRRLILGTVRPSWFCGPP